MHRLSPCVFPHEGGRKGLFILLTFQYNNGGQEARAIRKNKAEVAKVTSRPRTRNVTWAFGHEDQGRTEPEGGPWALEARFPSSALLTFQKKPFFAEGSALPTAGGFAQGLCPRAASSAPPVVSRRRYLSP